MPAPTLPSGTSAPRPSSARVDVVVGHRAGIRHVAVVALADDGRTTLPWPAPGGEHGRLVHRADRVRAAQVDGRADRPALFDLEHAGELAHPVDRRGAGGRRQRRRRDHGDPGALAAGGLRVADADAGHVGDRVPRPRLEAADRARRSPRQRSAIGGSGAVREPRRVVEQAGRELVRRAGGHRAGSTRSQGSKRRGQRGWNRHPVGMAVASGSSPVEQLALPAAARRGHRDRRRRGPACTDAGGARSRRPPCPARRPAPGTSRRSGRTATTRG